MSKLLNPTEHGLDGNLLYIAIYSNSELHKVEGTPRRYKGV